MPPCLDRFLPCPVGGGVPAGQTSSTPRVSRPKPPLLKGGGPPAGHPVGLRGTHACFPFRRRRWWDSPPSPAGRNPRPCHSERSEESRPRPSRFPPRGIAAAVGTKNMPPACFLNVPTRIARQIIFRANVESVGGGVPAGQTSSTPRVSRRTPVNPVGAGLCSARPKPPLLKGGGPPAGGGGIHPRPPQGAIPVLCHSERSEESHPPSLAVPSSRHSRCGRN
jgi:hypothetical protein